MSAPRDPLPLHTTDLRQLIQPRTVEASDAAARLAFLAAAEPGAVASLRGELTGPYSRWANTLPATYQLASPADANHRGIIAQALVADPCYWSPGLPLTYRLHAEAEFADGTRRELRASIGLERWGVDGVDLRREGKRVVLRAAAATGSPAELEAAREADMALIIQAPAEELCAAASDLGVAIIADLRGHSFADYERPLRALSWNPAVVAVLADERAPPRLPHTAPPRVAARVLRAATDIYNIAFWPNWTKTIAVQLQPDESLLAAPHFKSLPVIAIRRGVSYADLHEARAACDRLQADLAPKFNLAGYFVAPD